MGKKKTKHPLISDKEEVDVVVRRLMERMQSVYVVLQGEKIMRRLLAAEDGFLFLAFSQEDRDKYGLQVGQSAPISFFHEGKEYYVSLQILGAGRYEEKEALRFNYPMYLRINDDFCLTQLHLMPKKEVTFTTVMGEFCTGSIVNIGPAGVDVKSTDGRENKEVLAVNHETTMGFELSSDFRISVKGRVLYMTQFREPVVGVEFLDLDHETENRLIAWIAEQTASKKSSDSAFLKNGPKPQTAGSSGASPTKQSGDEYPTIYKKGAPYVLVLTRDDSLLPRLGKALSRKYGVLASKGRFARVEEIIKEYQPALVLIHEQLDVISGFDLAGTLKKYIASPPPFMIMGDQNDAEDKQKKCKSLGGKGYLVVEPFHMLAIFRNVSWHLPVGLNEG